jgi:hypothetical protein
LYEVASFYIRGLAEKLRSFFNIFAGPTAHTSDVESMENCAIESKEWGQVVQEGACGGGR